MDRDPAHSNGIVSTKDLSPGKRTRGPRGAYPGAQVMRTVPKAGQQGVVTYLPSIDEFSSV